MKKLVLVLVFAAVAKVGYAQLPDPNNNPVPDGTAPTSCESLSLAGITPQSLSSMAGSAVVAGNGWLAYALQSASSLESKACGLAAVSIDDAEIQAWFDEIDGAVQGYGDQYGDY